MPTDGGVTRGRGWQSGNQGTKNHCLPRRGIEYDMAEFLQSCVDRYLELANKPAASLRSVATPFLEITAEDHEHEERGELQPIAAKVLMKILYAARMARYDLLRPTCYLAAKITKWTPRCDRALHRLVSYIKCSLDIKMTSWVGDPLDKWELVVYSDADLAGDLETSRSTTGVFLCVRAANTFVTLQGISKRQSCVSHSTPEAEIVAADHAIRTEALPALQLWERIAKRDMKPTLMEDNKAAIIVITSGKNPNMRHMSRTHRINLAFLTEVVSNKHVIMRHAATDYQCADVFTKRFPSKLKWDPVVENIAHITGENPCRCTP